MADGLKSKIVKLNNNNYANWKFKMELLLRKQNLWKRVILGEKPLPIIAAGVATNQKEIDDWENLDDEARGTIGLCVEDDQLAHIRTKTTARSTWDALKNYHEKNTFTNKVFLMRSICLLKLEEGGDAREHINKMQDHFTKMSDIGEETLSDKWGAAMLLSSLPKSYDPLITSFESRREEEITFALVQERVIAEYERHFNASGHSGDAILKTVANTIVCYFCQNEGHLKKSCSKYKEWLAKQIFKKKDSRFTHRVNTVEEPFECQAMPSDTLKDFLF